MYEENSLMARFSNLSLESEDGAGTDNLVELTTEIVSAAGDDAGEMVELASDINQGARNMVALESLYKDFASREITRESLEQYQSSMEALMIGTGMPFKASSLVPTYSVEGNKTSYEYSVEAEEKKENLVQRIWEWIKEKFQQLVAWIKKVVLRQKGTKEAVAKKAEEVVEVLKKSEGDATEGVSLPANVAKYLVDASGNPVSLQKAVGFVVASSKGQADPALKTLADYINAGAAVNLAGMNKFAKSGSSAAAIGSKMVVTPGSDSKAPAAGLSVKFETPTPAADTKFPALKRGEVIRGLEAVAEGIRNSRSDTIFENLEDLLNKAVTSAGDGVAGSPDGTRLKAAIASYIGAVHGALGGYTQLAIKTQLAVIAYGKALNGGAAASKPNLPK